MIYTSSFMRPVKKYSRESESHNLLHARLEEGKCDATRSSNNSQSSNLQTMSNMNSLLQSKTNRSHHLHHHHRHEHSHQSQPVHLLPSPIHHDTKSRSSDTIHRRSCNLRNPDYSPSSETTDGSSTIHRNQLVSIEVHGSNIRNSESIFTAQSLENTTQSTVTKAMQTCSSHGDFTRGLSTECTLSCPILESSNVCNVNISTSPTTNSLGEKTAFTEFYSPSEAYRASLSREKSLTASSKENFNTNTVTFSDKLIYFPNMCNKLNVQFKKKEITPETFIRKQSSMGSFLPLIGASRTIDRYGTPVPIIVEQKHNNKRLESSAYPLERLSSRRRRFDSIWPQRDRNRSLKSLYCDKRSQESGSRTSMLSRTVSCGSQAICRSYQSNSIGSCPTEECRRIVLNVSGLKFEINTRLLDNHPTTLLGDSEKRKCFYDTSRKEYFFDRHRPSFEAIFSYYHNGGNFKRPVTVSDDVFVKELEFFQVEQDALYLYRKNEGYVPEVIVLPASKWKRKFWLLCEYPETSHLAFCISVTSIIFTVLSIILFCIETLPRFATTHCEAGDKPNFMDPFFIIETMCTLWFTIELIVRLCSCPNHKTFAKDLKNWIDLAAIIPYYITLTNVLISFSCDGAKGSASLAFLRVIRLIRVFKLTKHSSGLQVLVLTFKESVEGLGLFLVAFIVCILVFSSTIYYVETDRKGSQIDSIPDAFWWAVITMCTVGYGDKVPKSPLGKIVGSICAVAGVLTLAIPVPIITENFNKFYAYKTGRGRR